MKNYYSILGLPQNASGDAIKKAYRKLAMLYHPDKNPGNKNAEERFKNIAIAYGILSDRNKKAEYDKELYAFHHPPVYTCTNTSYTNTTNRNQSYETYKRRQAPPQGGEKVYELRWLILLLIMIFFSVMQNGSCNAGRRKIKSGDKIPPYMQRIYTPDTTSHFDSLP